MSIFDSTSGKDPTNWLKEKSLAALEAAVALVDLANEPDTTAWYAKNLKRIAAHLVSRLLPMTALFHGVGAEGVKNDAWQDIVERGTFALSKWCRRWNVANPHHFSEAVTARQRDESEVAEKSLSVQPDVAIDGDSQSSAIKLEIYRHMAFQMLSDQWTRPAKRLLNWALFHLHTSQYADIVVLSKTFLPTDIACTPEETAEGYRLLYESGLIEKVEGLDIADEAIALRLVVEGFNDSKYPPPLQEETFGKPGLRVGGKATVGNIFHLALDAQLHKYLEWVARSEEKIRQLHDFLQRSLGMDVAYIEKVRVVEGTGENSGRAIVEIQMRYPFDVDDLMMAHQLKRLVEKWIKESRMLVTK